MVGKTENVFVFVSLW